MKETASCQDQQYEVALRALQHKAYNMCAVCTGEDTLGTSAQPFAPMEVIGAMDDSGLGCLSWWNSGEDAMEE